MKKLKVSAPIQKLVKITAPDGSSVIRNGREITHRLHLSLSQSFEAAIRQTAVEVKRQDGIVASFCRKKTTGDNGYAIDLNANQVALLNPRGLSLKKLMFFIVGGTFNGTVELRNVGDVFMNVNTGKEEKIGDNKPEGQKNGFAAFTDMTATLPVDSMHILSNAIANSSDDGEAHVTSITRVNPKAASVAQSEVVTEIVEQGEDEVTSDIAATRTTEK